MCRSVADINIDVSCNWFWYLTECICVFYSPSDSVTGLFNVTVSITA